MTGSKVELGSLGKVPSAAIADSATHATNADSALDLGGGAASGYQRVLRWAVINVTPSTFTATVVRGNATGAGRVADGKFYANFAPDVRNCTYLANMTSAPGFATARAYSSFDPNAVEVDTYAYNSTGSPSDPPDGTSFNVAAIC